MSEGCVVDFTAYKERKRQQCNRSCGGCRECVNMIQYSPSSYICGALEDANTGESFFVIRNGEETVDYNNCEGECFVQKPKAIRPILRRKL